MMDVYSLTKDQDRWVVRGQDNLPVVAEKTKDATLTRWLQLVKRKATANQPVAIVIHSSKGEWQETRRYPHRAGKGAANWMNHFGVISKDRADLLLEQLGDAGA